MATKKVKKKKATKKVEGDIYEDIIDDLGKEFELQLMSADSKDSTPYYIPFRHLGLQYATGGVPGGKFTEIHGDSQCGKSFLLYELGSECLKMGGYFLLCDVENAYNELYGKRIGIGTKKFFKTTKNSIEALFSLWRKFVLKIRAVDKKAPILIGCDSYPPLQFKFSQDEIDSLEDNKDMKGFMAAKKNLLFNQLLGEFIGFINKHDVTFVLLNQMKKKLGVVFGDANTVNADESIKYYCTLRIRGTVGSKIKDKTTNKQLGVVSHWETVKNRKVFPFIKLDTKILYREGISKTSGLLDLLVREGKIEKVKEGRGYVYKYKDSVIDAKKVGEFIKENPSLLAYDDFEA
jgi:recombination protein RecA